MYILWISKRNKSKKVFVRSGFIVLISGLVVYYIGWKF